MIRMRWFLAPALLLAAACVSRACGPDFEPDVFVPAHRPVAPKEFAAGHLGLLQGRYFIAEKVVAYRYLNGGTLNEEERKQLEPIAAPGLDYDHMTEEEQAAEQAKESAPSARDRWLAARKPFGDAPAAAPTQTTTASDSAGWSSSIENCSDNAYDTAVKTLADRAAKWGATSASTKDWLSAQDEVFSLCGGSGPIPNNAPANAPLLLRQDRAYQVAAAMFYSGDYPAARDRFQAIAKDSSSPWSRWGLYLAARCEVRQAGKTAGHKDDAVAATFDPQGLEKASQLLHQALTTADPQVKHAAQAELDFVSLRLHPEEQATALAAKLAGPGHDPDFGQHLVDLRFLLDSGHHGDAPLLRWMTLTGSPVAYSAATAPGAATTPPNAETAWQQHHDLPLLVAALMNAKSDSPDLLAAAAAVPEASPAYVTVQFHRGRLLELTGHTDEVRSLATHLLQIARTQHDAAAANSVLGLRMKTAADLNALLADAPRTMITAQSESASTLGCTTGSGPACDPTSTPQFDEDAAVLFNTRLPLSLWIDAARTESMPADLRKTIALSAWLRAVMLDRKADADTLLPLLPAPVQASLRKYGDTVGFPATLVMLHSPGLRPYLDAGVQRAASYTNQDSFRDNLWCSTIEKAVPSNTDSENAAVLPSTSPRFLTSAQQQQAKAEVAALDTHPIGMQWLGRRTIDYVKAHPDDPVAAEALGLVVRMSRYECYPASDYGKSPSGGVSKEAFTLLHSRYPKSDWAAKTKYYF